MPKAKKLPSGNWRVRVFTHTDSEGKSHYKSFTAPSKKEAEYLASQFYVDKTQVQNCSDMTLRQAFERMLEVNENILSPSTIRGYSTHLRCHVQSIMGIKLSKLTNDIIQEALSKESERLAPKTIRNISGCLSVVLRRYAPSFKYDVKLPQKKKAKIYIPTEEEVKRLIEYVKDTPSYIPILLATCYGFRRSEICGLKWSHVDFDRKTITIECAKVIDKYNKPVEKDPKSYAGYRTLPLSDFLCEVLKAEKEKSTTENITTLSGSAIYNRFKRVLKKLGIPHFRFHDLRHYNASLMLAMGIPNKYAQARIGHATDNMLKNVYQHIMADKQTETNNIMSDYFDNLLAT